MVKAYKRFKRMLILIRQYQTCANSQWKHLFQATNTDNTVRNNERNEIWSTELSVSGAVLGEICLFSPKVFFYLFVFLSCADYSSPYNWHFFHCAGISLLLAVVQFHSCCCFSAVSWLMSVWVAAVRLTHWGGFWIIFWIFSH